MSKSRLATIVAKETLKEYSQGAAQSAIAPAADFLAPAVEVVKSNSYFKSYNDKTRFVIPDTSRALGGRATQIGWEKGDKKYDCTPQALDVPVDVAEGDSDDDMEYALQEAADLGAEVGGLAHEKKVLDLAVAALLPDLSNIDFAAGADIIDQLDQVAIEVLKGAGYGSAIELSFLLGPTFGRRLKNHASLKGRFGGSTKKDMMPADLDQITGLFLLKPNIKISMMVFDTEPMGKAPVRDFIIDDQMIVFARKSAPTRRDPSFMKTFRKRGAWLAPRTYMRDDGRVEVAALDWSEDVQITNTKAGKLLGITN